MAMYGRTADGVQSLLDKIHSDIGAVLSVYADSRPECQRLSIRILLKDDRMWSRLQSPPCPWPLLSSTSLSTLISSTRLMKSPSRSGPPETTSIPLRTAATLGSSRTHPRADGANEMEDADGAHETKDDDLYEIDEEANEEDEAAVDVAIRKAAPIVVEISWGKHSTTPRCRE